jgi:hypothetical protein
MEVHGIPWEFYGIAWNFPRNFMEFHETEVDGIPWNSMENFMEFHSWKISWNSMELVNSWNLMTFGFDRVLSRRYMTYPSKTILKSTCHYSALG